MAAENITENKDIALRDTVRGLLALEATWEIEQLANLTIDLAAEFDDIEALQFRGIGARIKELNSAIMSAIGEHAVTNDALSKMIRCHPLPKAEV